MNKWKPSSGRYSLTKGLKKRLWSAYYSFVGSTGGDGNRSDFLEGGSSPNELQYSSGSSGSFRILCENSDAISTEGGSSIVLNHSQYASSSSSSSSLTGIYTVPTSNNNVSTVSQSPFAGGGNSYSFPGDGYLSVEGSDNWAVGTGDFTIEWFQYETDSSPFPRIFAIGSYPSTSIGCSIEGGTFYAWCSGPDSFGTVDVKNAWHHFAIVRRSNQLYAYKDGVQLGSSTSNSTNITDSSTTLYIGAENAGTDPRTFFAGYLTNIRWVKGLAVYTGNFTVPTSSLTAVASANPYGGNNTQEIIEGYTKLLFVPS